jgi:hypothetical protein
VITWQCSVLVVHDLDSGQQHPHRQLFCRLKQLLQKLTSVTPEGERRRVLGLLVSISMEQRLKGSRSGAFSGLNGQVRR